MSLDDGPNIAPFKCVKSVTPGWKCIRWARHDGPCALVPRWWNLIDRWHFRRML